MDVTLEGKPEILDNISFDCLWGKDDDKTRQDVKNMWRRYRALDGEALMEKRSREIVFVIRNRQGDVGGVSTVRCVRAKMLDNHFFYEFRCFISPPFSAPGLDSVLAAKTKTFLEERQRPESDIKGLLMIIENEAIKKQRTKAVWPATEMVFAGYTGRGHHIRVGYFKGARI